MSRHEVIGKMYKLADGRKVRKCMKCNNTTSILTHKVCRGCGGVFRRKEKPKKKPSRGSAERIRLELKHAQNMAQEWGSKVRSSVSKWDEWTKLARALQARIDLKRLEFEKPKGMRALKLAGEL